jgi:maltose O-acetyltransferase
MRIKYQFSEKETRAMAQAQSSDVTKSDLDQLMNPTNDPLISDLMNLPLDELLDKYPDLKGVFDGSLLQYRKSDVLPRMTWWTQSMCDTFNRLFFRDPKRAMALFRRLIPQAGQGVDVRPPIMLDYGVGLVIGDRTFINTGFLIIGGGNVHIGSDCLIGPRCSIYTPNHEIASKPRLEGWQHNEDVTIGNNVWLGGNVTVCPGASIGDNCVIGAGAVVSSSIPANSVAVGVPCRAIKRVPADSPATDAQQED